MNESVNQSNKSNGRFIILIIMLLIVAAITVWAAMQSVTGINNEVTPVTDNNITATPSTTPASTPVSTGTAKVSGQVAMDNLGKEILSKVKFETELKQLDKTVAEDLIEVSPDSKLQLYMGNGNYSDELILITASSKENAIADQETAVKYLKDMRKSFEAYIPEQAQKISNAFNMRSGCYVVVCVTNDIDTAKEVILAAFE